MSQTAPAAAVRSSGLAAAEAVVDAYLRMYDRLVRQRSGIFASELQSALVALVHYRSALRGSASRAALVRRVEAIDAATRHVLQRTSVHSSATDLAGYVWAATYGALPLAEPPLPQIEWVFVSGAASGAVSGLTGMTWRALFLETSLHLLHYDLRRKAEPERDRHVEAIIKRADAFVDAARSATEAGAASVVQTVPPLADLAHVSGAGEVSALAAALLEAVPGARPAHLDATPSARLAQRAAALAAVGKLADAEAIVDYLLACRVDRERQLLHRNADPGLLETSPWVPLALLSVI